MNNLHDAIIKKLKSFEELQREKLIACGYKTQNLFSRCCQPIYAIQSGDLKPIGTGIFLIVNKRRYFVSAAHVFNQNLDIPVGTILAGKPYEVHGNLLTTANQARRNDRYDFIWKDVSDDSCDIGDEHFYAEGDDLGELNGPGHCFTAIGFPSSRHKIHHASRQGRAEMIAVSNLGVVSGDFIKIMHSKRDCVNEAGATVNAPRLNGMSGGGIFYVGNLADPNFWTDAYPIKLAGLVTEQDVKTGEIIGTKMSFICGAIKHIGAYNR